VHVDKTRLNTNLCRLSHAGYSCGLALLVFLLGSKALQNAVAEGDTRTISLHHMHTDEDITITFKRDGKYDEAALEKLNWFLRDWRRSESTKMDPHLIDLVWEVQREAGAKDPIWVVCGYRSPQTNAMLRRNSNGVARFSQHMLGKAMDFYIPNVPLAELRAYGLRLERGGVGFYPESGSPFVHMDTGGIRMWPRMSHEELERVFPDGRTVHIPSDGRPLRNYALALADIKKRGGMPSENSIAAARQAGIDVSSVEAAGEPKHTNPIAKLLGFGKNNDDEEEAEAAAPAAAPAPETKTAAAKPDSATASAKTKVKAAVVAAVEKVEKKAEAAGANAVALAKAGSKLIQTAAAGRGKRNDGTAQPAEDANTRVAALSPNEVITARGYWQGLPDSATAAQTAAKPANPLANEPRPRRADVASAAPESTGTVTPWSGARDEARVPGTLALAYAEPGHDAASQVTPMAAAMARAAATLAARLVNRDAATTVAVKGLVEQPETAPPTANEPSMTSIKMTDRLDNPWVRAIMLSPSVHQFLTTLALGSRDFTTLAQMMVKPDSAVAMTFGADPNPGMSHDQFTGSAIVFIPTVTYATHTAALP